MALFASWAVRDMLRGEATLHVKPYGSANRADEPGRFSIMVSTHALIAVFLATALTAAILDRTNG